MTAMQALRSEIRSLLPTHYCPSSASAGTIDDMPQSVLAASPGALLALRVRALLEAKDDRNARSPHDLLPIACAVATAALLIAMWPNDGVHHSLETLIGWTFAKLSR